MTSGSSGVHKHILKCIEEIYRKYIGICLGDFIIIMIVGDFRSQCVYFNRNINMSDVLSLIF